jgi:hypothetical protein
VLHGQKHTGEVRVEGSPPDRQIEIGDFGVAFGVKLDPGYPDDRIETAKGFDRPRDGRLDMLLVGDIRRDAKCLAAGRRDLGNDLIELLALPIRQGHSRALLRESDRDCPSDSRRGTRDECSLARELTVIRCRQIPSS